MDTSSYSLYTWTLLLLLCFYFFPSLFLISHLLRQYIQFTVHTWSNNASKYWTFANKKEDLIDEKKIRINKPSFDETRESPARHHRRHRKPESSLHSHRATSSPLAAGASSATLSGWCSPTLSRARTSRMPSSDPLPPPRFGCSGRLPSSSASRSRQSLSVHPRRRRDLRSLPGLRWRLGFPRPTGSMRGARRRRSFRPHQCRSGRKLLSARLAWSSRARSLSENGNESVSGKAGSGSSTSGRFGTIWWAIWYVRRWPCRERKDGGRNVHKA